MKKIITGFFLFVLSTNAFSQNVDLNAPLPVDKSIKKGKLPNGMTYYIKHTTVTKGVASYYIIQNVGSILENDNQQGLAHFLEHMAFNGTKNFAGKGILTSMQQQGLVFGRDINAYTSFDETVYNVNNIPNTAELIDKGLLILHDWSHYLLLSDKEIDAERGVIKEEWRTRQNGDMRIFEQTSAIIFNHSKYAKRFPIGKMDIVENFKYSALKDFYHDWYRTDLQAIAVIGDIDPEMIENKIKKLFSGIPAVNNPLERFVEPISDNKEMLYTIATDPEITTASMTFGIRHAKSLKEQTTANLKEDLLNAMAVKMLSSRIADIGKKSDAPYLEAYVDFSPETKSTKLFNFYIIPKPGKQKEALKTVVDEINRAVKFGFTQGEINRTAAEFISYYENQIITKNDRTHEEIEQTIQNNYLHNETIIAIESEFDLVKYFLDNLNQNEINGVIKKLYIENNRFVQVTGIKGENNLSKEEAIKVISDSDNNATLQAYKDEFDGKTLISGIDIKTGKIASEEINKELGSTTFVLSNGIKVHYKFANKNKNTVQLRAESYGGNSLLADADLPSASIVQDVLQNSGLGDYSAVDLPKVLAGKNAEAVVSISGISENIAGSSVTKDTETMLQMVYLRFMKPRFDIEGYKIVMENMNNKLIAKSENIEAKMSDSMTVALYGPAHSVKRIFDQKYLDDMSFDKVESVYRSRFANAVDFEFFIVGDIAVDSLRPLLEKYIASIAVNGNIEKWKDNTVSWQNKNTVKTVALKMTDPKSIINICYKNDIDFSLKNQLLSRALSDMLRLRFDETLREQEGGTYGASTYQGISKRPREDAFLIVYFDCNPDKVQKLVGIVHNEINKIAAGNIDQKDLDKTLTNYIKDRKQEKELNAYGMNLLLNFYREDYNMNKAENFEKIIESIKKQDLQKYTKALLKDARSYEFILNPKL